MENQPHEVVPKASKIHRTYTITATVVDTASDIDLMYTTEELAAAIESTLIDIALLTITNLKVTQITQIEEAQPCS